jgi:nitrous oxidase accessory protein NosD
MPEYRLVVRSIGDDVSAEIQAALDAVHAAGGGEVQLGPGDFPCADHLTVRARTVLRGMGGARLRMLDPARSSVFLEGEDVEVRGIALAGGARTRSSSDRSMGFRARGCRGLTIADCAVSGTAAAGIMLRGCEDVLVSGNRIEGTLADGIHVTERCRHVVISGNRLVRTGDDGIGLVGYQKDGGPVRNVAVVGNAVRDGKARGISCLGAHHVAISGNVVDGTDAAGVYVAQEGGYGTYGSRAVSITGNVLSAVSRRVGHAGLFVDGGDGVRATAEGGRLSDRVEEVALAGNVLDGSGHDGIRVGPDAARVRGGANLVAGARRSPGAVSGEDVDIGDGWRRR